MIDSSIPRRGSFVAPVPVREHMRAIDWSSTALGPREEWSPYLQSSVTFCLNSSFPMAVYWGPEFVLIYNDAYSRFLGDVHPKALGRPAPEFSSQLWDSSLRQHLQQQLDRCVSKRVPFREEEKRVFMLRYGYPEECFFDYSLDPVPADNGTIGGVIEVCVETTYRVIAERRLRTLRELAKRASAGRSADEVYARAVEALSAAPSDVPFALLYRADADGRTASLSAATGIEKGSPAAPLVVKLVESETERSPWPFGAAVRSGKPVVVSTVDDRYHGLKESLWPEPVREALVLPITAAGLGAFAGFFVAGVSPHRKLDDGYRTFFEFAAEHIATALAEVTAYETQYRRAETLGEVDRAKTVFFSNVSHEFRTPLTLILGPLAEALAASDLPAALREPLGLARRNVLRLTKLVNALLEFSRIEAGRENVSYEPTDLSTLTRAIAGNFESIIRSAGLSLRFACEPLPEPVFVDREMWAKIVLNLVSNAFKFTLEGGIEVGTRAVGANFELFVRDTGVGIPEAELTRVFERFHRLDTTRGRTLEGSGIGLALVEELVKLHGGSVRVESALGRGSTFTVAIPFGTAHLPSERVRRGRERDSLELGVEAYVEEARRWNSTTDAPQVPASPAVEHVPSTPTVTADERDVKPARPLIVLADDCADMREYMRRLLAPHYAVEAVPDGQAALEFARTTRPDLVLTDVMMPRLDGFGLLRELRSDPRLRTVPVILVTAVAGDDSCVQALDAGADDYLVKPFGNRELLARVRATMELDRLRTDVERAAGREEALRAESRRKDDFLAVLSHELRTPLTPLQLQLHLIEESLGQQSTLEAPAARTRLLQLLASSARQLDGLSLLVEDVLEFLSITEGPVTIHREAFDLSDLTRTVLRRDSSKTTSPIELHAETVVRGQWDRHRIEQVVTKLLANATKYGQGKPISVSVSESDADGRHHAILSVEDHGVGIAEKDQSRIFETFERAVSTRHFGGLGLGLYVSRRIVEAHGGSLHVESQPGEGATFTLELPMPA